MEWFPKYILQGIVALAIIGFVVKSLDDVPPGAYVVAGIIALGYFYLKISGRRRTRDRERRRRERIRYVTYEEPDDDDQDDDQPPWQRRRR